MSPSRLLAVLSTVADPRVARTRVHKLVDILAIALLALINRADGWDDIALFAQAREEWLRGFLELPGGIPCADTFRRVFEAMDTRDFGRCLAELTADLVQDLEGKVVAIDGKTLRGSFDRRSGQSPLHVVSAWVADAGITLGQIVTEQKSNEITAIPALLNTIDVQGATVTIDAMGCQKKVATAIVARGADYVLALKDNHPKLRNEVEAIFAKRTTKRRKRVPVDTYTTKDAGHGRHEIRRVSVCTVIDDLHEIEHWPRLCSIAMVERERPIGDKTSSEKAYYLSSLTVDARKMAHNIRAHWSIENTLHWTLDVAFREDSSRVRSRGAATNMAALRKLVLSLLKLEPSKPGTSMRMKQKICGWKPDYAFDVLRTISRS